MTTKFKEFEKRYGKLPGAYTATTNKDEIQTNVVVNCITIVFQLFITGPNKNWRNPLAIIGSGIVLLGSHLLLLFSQTAIEKFIHFIDFGNSIAIVMHATIYIYTIIQCIRGIWIIGGWNQNPIGYSYKQLPPSGKIVRGGSRAYYKNNPSVLPNAISETYSWMNSQMQSMTNRQRENYLRGFHGGKKGK